jgi:hypothetical protein
MRVRTAVVIKRNGCFTAQKWPRSFERGHKILYFGLKIVIRFQQRVP